MKVVYILGEWYKLVSENDITVEVEDENNNRRIFDVFLIEDRAIV